MLQDVRQSPQVFNGVAFRRVSLSGKPRDLQV